MTVPWIDISVPIYSGMVHWPDNPAVLIERMQDMSRGDAANVSKLELGAHTGTHMDAPHHFFADGAGLVSRRPCCNFFHLVMNAKTGRGPSQ